VPWYRAFEFFTALRRLAKEATCSASTASRMGFAIGDGHEVLDRPHGRDFETTTCSESPSRVVTRGVPYIDKGTRDVLSLFKEAG